MPDSTGRLTREEMEAVLDRNESVIHNGVHIKSKDMLPSPIDLALNAISVNADDTYYETEEGIDERIAALQSEKDRITEARAQAKAKVDADAQAKADADAAKAKADADAKGSGK